MKVGDLIKLRDGTIVLVIKVWDMEMTAQGRLVASYFIIHTGEAFFPDCQHLEGWQAV